MKSKIRLILRENTDADEVHQDALKKTGFWGKAGAGAIIIARSTGRLLLPKRSSEVLEPNTWGVWGGAIDPTEDPKEAARREIAEECGYTGNIELLPLYLYKDSNSGFRYFNFLGVVDKEFKPRLDWENSTSGWFNLRKLPTPLHFGLLAVLRDSNSLNTIQKFANAPNISEQTTIKNILREGLDKIITCKKCKWHWKESESSDKEMYKCHKCGHDNTPNLKEHLQLADKVYFQTGKLSPQAREIILDITNGDAYTKIISDMYFVLASEFIKGGGPDILSRDRITELENAHRQLTTYNKNVFPIEGFDILNNQNPYNLMVALRIREEIIVELKKLPTVAVKNLRADIRTPRIVSELNQYSHTLEYFMGNFSYLSNRDPKFQQVILNKMFKEGSTLDAWMDFVEEKQNMLGGVQFTRNMVKKIVREAYDSDLDIVYDKGNVMIVEVTGPKGIAAIGCNSLWCFTYGGGNNWNQWDRYSTNGIVYAIFDFSKPSDSEDFMYVLLKPLSDSDPDPEDQDYDEHDSPLFNMSNEPEMYATSIIDRLIGLNTAKKILTFGEEPVKVPKIPVKKPQFVDPNQLSLFESLRKKVIREYISQDMVSLRHYFLSSDEEKIQSLPEAYWWFFDDFLIEENIDFIKPKDSVDVNGDDIGDDIEGYDLLDWLSRNNPELHYKYGEYLFNKIKDFTLPISDAEYPAWAYFDNPKVVKNQWLIHFCNDADSIARDGFTLGVNEIDKLGLTTHLSEFEKKYGGYNFSYRVEDFMRYGRSRGYGHEFKYGNEAVIFNASGVMLWHNSDEEPQVIFYGNTAKNIIAITHSEDSNWAIRNTKTNRIIFENDSLETVVNWVQNNFIQYRNAI